MVKRSKAFTRQKFKDTAITLEAFLNEKPIEDLMVIFRQLDNNYMSPKCERLIAEINEQIMEGNLRYENASSVDAETGYYRIRLNDLFRELSCCLARGYVMSEYKGTLYVKNREGLVAKEISLGDLCSKEKNIIENIIDSRGGGYDIGDVLIQLGRAGEYKVGDTLLVYE